MDQDLDQIKTNYLTKINLVATDSELEQVRIEIFGRNGLINDLFSKIKEIPNEIKNNTGLILIRSKSN